MSINAETMLCFFYQNLLQIVTAIMVPQMNLLKTALIKKMHNEEITELSAEKKLQKCAAIF